MVDDYIIYNHEIRMHVLFLKPRERGKEEWSSVSKSAKPGVDILISNLIPATWYQIKVIQSSENEF